jgi:hypothetical protein
MGRKKYVMTEDEKYFFDLTGYLVVRQALSREAVDECNHAIDHYAERIAPRTESLAGSSTALAGEKGRLELTGMLGWPSPYREPFRSLLAHPVLVSRLNEICGKRFRLDHGPLLIGGQVGSEGHTLHGSGEPFQPHIWYHYQNGQIFCRGVTVAWQLADVNEGDGGFAIVPGSHKTNEPTPEGVRTVEDDMGVVKQPVMEAGDVLFFAETATHGTLPWKGAHERRSVLYKYSSRAAVRDTGRHFNPEDRFGDWTRELATEQRAVLYGPGNLAHGKLHVVESDGQKTWVAS